MATKSSSRNHYADMAPRVSLQVRWSIVADCKAGKTSYSAIARKHRVKRHTVRDIFAKFLETGTVEDSDRPGRPRTTSPTQDTELLHIVRRHPDEPSHRTSARLRERTGANLAPSTVRRRLVAAGLSARPFTSKPALTINQKAKRLAFAKRHRNRKWRNVLFSDEAKFLLGSRKRLVRRKSGEKIYKRTFKHPGGVNVWGCFGRLGFGDIHIFRENMTADIYVSILDDHLLQSAKHAVSAAWIFQEDNDPKHRSRAAQAWLQRHDIKRLDWPSNSPDVNPMENVWAPLKDRVAARGAKNLDQLEQFIREEWAKLSREFAEHLVNSMPNRMQALMDAGGDAIDY